jgi:hypothetical protein
MFSREHAGIVTMTIPTACNAAKLTLYFGHSALCAAGENNMFSVKIGRVFEVEVNGGLFVRLGCREFYWCREDGFMTDRRPA